MSARLFNFGCGETFHPDWTNFDASPVSPDVIVHDMRRRFPFADRTFDAAYESHVLEHLKPAVAEEVLRDCFRILRPGGISDHTRSRFVAERIGCEGTQAKPNQVSGFSMASRVQRKLRSMADSIRRTATIASASVFLGPRGAAAVREGLFRDGGEVHQWMYDRFSLARALRKAGFASIQRRLAGESGIPGFAGYELEIVNGRERKPDSLYMEARKPSAPEA